MKILKNKSVYKFLAFFLIIILIVSLYLLLSHRYETYSAERNFDSLREVKSSIKNQPSTEAISQDNSGKKESTDENFDSFKGFVEEKRWYENLYSQNNDMMAWIYLGEANIDYPVMYRAKDYYLRRDFYKNYSISGTPFFDKGTPLRHYDDKSKINIIYGHNMRNGTMFSNLKMY